MLIRRCIGPIELHGRGGEGGFEIADRAVGGRTAINRSWNLRVRGRLAQVILGRLRGVAHVHQRGAGTGLLEALRDHEGDREAEKTHQVGIERGFCACETIRQVKRAPWRLRRCIILGQYEQHAGRALGIAYLYASDTALADRCGHDKPVRGLVLCGIFECVLGAARHLQRAVDTIERATDRSDEVALRHGESPYARPAAWVSVARSVRRASGILKSLWPYPRASRSAAVPAASNDARVAGAFTSAASASSERHGL